MSEVWTLPAKDFVEASARVVKFPGVSCFAFRELLLYLYTDRAPSPRLSPSNCLSVIELANRLCLPESFCRRLQPFSGKFTLMTIFREIYLILSAGNKHFDFKSFAEADLPRRGRRRRQDGEGLGDEGRQSRGRRGGHGGRAQDHRILPSESLIIFVKSWDPQIYCSPFLKVHNALQLGDWCLHYLAQNYNQICRKFPKVLRTFHPENQAWLNVHRWPPIWYVDTSH